MDDASVWSGRYLEYLRFEKRYSTHTLTAYKHDLEQFFDFCAGNSCNPLCADLRRCRQWLAALSEEGCSARTLNRKITSLRTFFKYLVRQEVVPASPMDGTALLRTPRRLPSVVASDKMRELFGGDVSALEFADLRDFVLVSCLYHTGMRLSELIGLNEPDVDFGRQIIRVTGKRDKQRIIPLLPAFAAQLELYLEKKRRQPFDAPSEALFVLDSGRRLYPVKVWRVCRKWLSLVTTQEARNPHVLRHSFATHLLEHNAELDAIKLLLGHAGLAATQVYTHNTIHTIQSVYNQAHPRA